MRGKSMRFRMMTISTNNTNAFSVQHNECIANCILRSGPDPRINANTRYRERATFVNSLIALFNQDLVLLFVTKSNKLAVMQEVLIIEESVANENGAGCSSAD
ncbi:uncharacterized protein LOC105429917 [Pogonomyrmex barbatus]|uniref:Uncharacterized protein LOC105429917 n=1 Tax=Pogonomyrmex barbatus TaxID=144034 RepID=A0A6I9WFR7_9HYME|nr:uncharacterized protein LOC105429917 [Pogonomyrmex barbatus]